MAQEFNGSAYSNKTGAYTSDLSEGVICVDATSGALALKLPAATGSGRFLRIKKVDASANAVTVTPNGTDKVEGASTVALSSQYAFCTLFDDSKGVWLKF